MPRNGRRDDRDYRDRGYKDRDYRDRDYDRESDRSDRSDRHEKRVFKPPTYREAMKHDHHSTSGSEFDATEHSFVQADDDHPQKVFIERVITPRVKPKKQASPAQQKRVIPPPEEDLTYDSIEPKKSKIAETQKDEEAETDESDTSNTDNESSEEDTDSDIDPGPKKADKPDAKDEYSKVNKKGGADGGQGQPQGFMAPQQGFMPPPNVQGQGYPGFFPPGVQQPQPRYGYPMQQYPPYPGQQPPQGPMMQPQGPGMQAQAPGPRPDPYSQANFTVPMNQPGPGQYPQQPPAQRQPHPSKRRDKQPVSQQPNNPPIYSYLVNRGYHPVDGRHSPVSTSTGGTNLSGDKNMLIEDSDFSANLDSGVEFMKRKT